MVGSLYADSFKVDLLLECMSIAEREVSRDLDNDHTQAEGSDPGSHSDDSDALPIDPVSYPNAFLVSRYCTLTLPIEP